MKRLAVHVLPQSWGIPSPQPFAYPATVRVALPRAWADKVAAYGVEGIVLLAPAGWTEDKSVTYIATDGGEQALMHATGTSAIVGQLHYESTEMAQVLCRSATFPGCETTGVRPEMSGLPAPTARSGLVERLVGSQLAEYRLSSGQQVDDGLQVNGVAHTTISPGQ